ncbi:hypothetical protein, partial [Actinomadura roseirufa]|uniref:hypothetical protein n=1 Tax=Actinomadura roseirufa TaxID=2094049 RepID=UPI0013F154E8
PGLARWPRPGEAVLSRALARAGRDERISTRYGRFAGLIAASGLASPSERLAYVRPVDETGARADWQPVTGFGDTEAPRFGESLAVEPVSEPLTAVAALIGLPAALLLLVAVRLPGGTRPRAAAGIAGIGTAIGLVPAVAATVTDLPIPGTGYVLPAASLRDVAWALPLIAVAVPPLVAGAMALRRIRLPAVRPAPRRGAWLAGVSALVVLGTAETGRDGDLVPALLFWTGVAGVTAGLSAAAGGLAGPLGRLITRLGGRWGGAAAGDRLAARPAIMTRLAAAALLGLGPAALLGGWAGHPGDDTARARWTFDRIGTSVQVVDAGPLTGDRIAAFARRLPPGPRLLALSTAGRSGDPVLRGSCPVLLDLGLTCAPVPVAVAPGQVVDPRMQELLYWAGGADGGMLVQDEASRGPAPDSLVVVTGVRDAVPEWVVKQAAYAALPPGAHVEALGGGWRQTTSGGDGLGAWIRVIAAPGLVFVLLAGLLGAAAELLRPDPAGRPAPPTWTLGPPLLAAALTAAVAVWWLAGQLNVRLGGGGAPPWPVLSDGLTAAATLALLAALPLGTLPDAFRRTALHSGKVNQ